MYGDSKESSLVSIVAPDEDVVRSWVSKNGRNVADETFESICRSPELHNTVLQDIQKLSKDAGLQGFETVKAIYITPKPFTVEDDLITPTFKLKRNKIQHRYEKEIADMYANISGRRSKL